MREKEPVIIHTPKTAVDNELHDGGLEPAVGVHNYQVFRANRTTPQDKNYRCYTHNHQPMLAYWNGRFYLQYLAGLHNEHEERTETFLTWSDDGIRWSTPEVIFPAIEYVMFRYTISHQRVGFYVAPNGRLLTFSFYGIPREGDPSRLPNHGKGVGRAIREIHHDGTLGPIYFFRYMPKAGYTEENTSQWYPHYKKSEDPGFVEACDALYADRLFCQQMWEEDRNNDDGFFGIHWTEGEYATGKALSYWTNPDGSVTGMWKSAFAAVTKDEGATWSDPVDLQTPHKNNAKYWGQRSPDGKYLLVYCPTEKPLRAPLAAVVGTDGQNFSEMCLIHGDVPVQRFWGFSRDPGPQYVRGVVEGNGTPPGDYAWVTYSMNKEDIWISRIPTPVVTTVDGAVDDDFAGGDTGVLDRWNIYSGLWAGCLLDKTEGKHCLKLFDEDPYDYARALRVFPETKNLIVRFSLRADGDATGAIYLDVSAANGARLVQLAFDFQKGMVLTGPDQNEHPGGNGTLRIGKWCAVELYIDVEKAVFDILIEGERVVTAAPFAETASSVKRLELRTGPYRMKESRTFIPYKEIPQGSPDLEGADTTVPRRTYSIGYIRTVG